MILDLSDLLGFKDGLREDVLVHLTSGKWAVFSEQGKRLGVFETEEQARERLRQIEAAKAAKGDTRVDGEIVTRVDRMGPVRFIEDESTPLEPHEFAARLTPEGYLRIEGNISGTGVYQYSDGESTWGELRLPEHVFAQESLDSFKMVPITDDHPAEMVNAKNIRQLQRGHLGSNVRKSEDGKHVVADMLITDPALIEKIKNGKCELSNGYEAVVIQQDGVAEDGTPYQAVQTRISGNHTAVVDQARGGPTCRLLFDAVGIEPKDKTTMLIKDGKIMIGEMEFDVPDAVAESFMEMKQKVEEQGAELAKLAAEGDSADSEKPMEDEMPPEEMEDEVEEPKPAMDGEAILAKMQAKIDMLEGQLAESSARIDARVNLVASAREILGDQVKTDGVSDMAIKKAVCSNLLPNLKEKIDASQSADYVDAMYEAALEQHKARVDSSTELLELTHQAVPHVDEFDIDGALKAYQDTLRTRSEKGIN